MQILGNDSELAVKKDQEYLWHNITPYSEKNPPMIAASASGSWITDIQGNRFLDGMSGLWCVNVGYGRKELAEAAYNQLLTLPYFPLTQSHLPAIALAEKLNEWLGDDYVIFFSNSGSEANEAAFKMARQYQQQIGQHYRHKFIARYRGYHGSSLGALSATGQAQRKYKYEPLAGGFLHVAPPDSYRRPVGMTVEEFNLQCAQSIEDMIIWEGVETVAAVIMEPVITGGGVIVPHQVYLDRVQEICRKHGVLLIMDEVICGFGRSGRKFGHHNFNVKPDIVTMAKGLTSAYLPLSATAVRKDIYEVFKDNSDDYGHFRHVNTFGGNPASCALALRNLEIIEQEKLVERADLLGKRINTEFTELLNHKLVGDVRSFGLVTGIELVEDKVSKKPVDLNIVKGIIAECKSKGLIIGKNGDTVAGFNNVLTFAPPLSSTDEDIEFIIDTFKSVLNGG